MPVALVLVGLLLAVLTAAAMAASGARDEYVEYLEATCKPGVEATQRAVKGVRSDVQAERLTVAAGKLGRARRIFSESVTKMSAVPRPEADASQLEKWFAYLRLEEGYLGKAAAALRREQIANYQRNLVRFVHTGNVANDVVIVFGFDYCRFNFRRFN